MDVHDKFATIKETNQMQSQKIVYEKVVFHHIVRNRKLLEISEFSGWISENQKSS